MDDKMKIYQSVKEVLVDTIYGQYNVLSSDYISKKLLNGVYYEKDKIDKVLSHLNEGDVVVDVGANLGIHSIPYGKKIGENGKLYLFEPQCVIYNLLEKNVKRNLPTNLQYHLYNCALGHITCNTTMNAKCDKNRIIDYHRSQETNYGGLNLGIGGEHIDMITLDSLKLDKVNYIKIDVEGAEKLVIYGARRTIEDHRPLVFFEENWKTITSDMIKMYNLSSNIINFNIKEFFLKELNYKNIEKIGSNFLALP